MQISTADFLKQSRQRAILEKRVHYQRQLRYQQGAQAAALNTRLEALRHLEQNPGTEPPAALANVMSEIKADIDYSVSAFAMKQGYRAEDISEAMKSEMYDREYVTNPETVDTVVSRAQAELHHRREVAEAEL